MLKLKKPDSIWWPVDITGIDEHGCFFHETVKVKYKYLTKTEFRAVCAVDDVDKYILDWDGFYGEDDLKLPTTKENIAAVMEIPFYSTPLTSGFVLCHTQAPEKN